MCQRPLSEAHELFETFAAFMLRLSIPSSPGGFRGLIVNARRCR
jgi:hypothetical protein